jgi:GTP-binding protein EngB required for normal cell division
MNIISCHYLVIGKTGVGKSYIIDGLTDHKYNIPSELQPDSTTTNNTYYDNYIDTIGLDDTNLGKYPKMPQWLKNFVPKNTDINGISVGLLAIYDSLDTMKTNNIKLNKILFVITDIKVSDTERNILRILKAMIKSNLLLIINKVDDMEETTDAYEKHRKQFEDIFGLHDVFYFSRGKKSSSKYKESIARLKETLKKYDNDDFSYELNKNHVNVILNGDPDFILNYYHNLDCDGYRNTLQSIDKALNKIVIQGCNFNVEHCKICHKEKIGENCRNYIVYEKCKDIWGERCSYDNNCLNHQQTAFDKCLDLQKGNNAAMNKFIDDGKAAQRYLTENCDISKRTSYTGSTEL